MNPSANHTHNGVSQYAVAAAPKPVPPTPAELRAEIIQTRAALGDTTEALVERLDVPARIRSRVSRSSLLTDRGTLVGAAVAVVSAAVAIWAFSRHRGR